MAKTIGTGMAASGLAGEGIVRRAHDIDDVFRLLKDPQLEETILLTESPSATAIVPLLAQIRGIICTTGGVTSHVAIVSREFGLPCVVAADVGEPSELEGVWVSLAEDGTIAAD